jgi:hypothetical protein
MISLGTASTTTKSKANASATRRNQHCPKHAERFRPHSSRWALSSELDPPYAAPQARRASKGQAPTAETAVSLAGAAGWWFGPVASDPSAPRRDLISPTRAPPRPARPPHPQVGFLRVDPVQRDKRFARDAAASHNAVGPARDGRHRSQRHGPVARGPLPPIVRTHPSARTVA